MGILDNLENAWDDSDLELSIQNPHIKDDAELCHYCTNKAKYTDVAEIAKQGYAVIGVCQCHFVQDVTS